MSLFDVTTRVPSLPVFLPVPRVPRLVALSRRGVFVLSGAVFLCCFRVFLVLVSVRVLFCFCLAGDFKCVSLVLSFASIHNRSFFVRGVFSVRFLVVVFS